MHKDYRKKAAETLPTITAVSHLLISASIFFFFSMWLKLLKMIPGNGGNDGGFSLKIAMHSL